MGFPWWLVTYNKPSVKRKSKCKRREKHGGILVQGNKIMASLEKKNPYIIQRFLRERYIKEKKNVRNTWFRDFVSCWWQQNSLKVYWHTWRTSVVSYVVKHFLDNSYLFQTDKAPMHSVKIACEYKQNNNIHSIIWLAQSPDINMI